MRFCVLKTMVLFSIFSMSGCSPADESSKESTDSPPVVVVKTSQEGAAATLKSSTEIDPSIVGIGPDEDGYEYVWADDGSGKIIGYIWYDGYSTNNCEGDVIVQFRVKKDARTTSDVIFDDHPKMNSFIQRNHKGMCILRR